jgi:hypothetical protein
MTSSVRGIEHAFSSARGALTSTNRRCFSCYGPVSTGIDGTQPEHEQAQMDSSYGHPDRRGSRGGNLPRLMAKVRLPSHRSRLIVVRGSRANVRYHQTATDQDEPIRS